MKPKMDHCWILESYYHGYCHPLGQYWTNVNQNTKSHGLRAEVQNWSKAGSMLQWEAFCKILKSNNGPLLINNGTFLASYWLQKPLSLRGIITSCS